MSFHYWILGEIQVQEETQANMPGILFWKKYGLGWALKGEVVTDGVGVSIKKIRCTEAESTGGPI